MSTLFNKKDLEPSEYITKYALLYLQMKKTKDEGVTKILQNEENQ